MDNNLNDKNVASVFEALSTCQNGGLKSFSLIKNQIGNLTVQSLANHFFCSDSAKYIRKFQIKNPKVVCKNLRMEVVFH